MPSKRATQTGGAVVEAAAGVTTGVVERADLERQAAHLAAIVDASDDAIVSKDLEGIIVSWNRAAEELFGYTAAEVIGQSIRIIIPPDRQQEEDQVLATIRSGAIVDHFETERLRKDGTLVPITLTVSPIYSRSGEIIGASKIARDLSGGQRMVRDTLRLAAIVDSSDDAIIGTDLNGVITSWNEAAESMFGFIPAEVIGRSIRMMIPDEREHEEDDVLFKIRSGNRVEHYDTVRRRKDGTDFPTSISVSPIRQPDGVVIGASKIIRDVTERKRAEEERQRLLAIAREASRMKDEFLATLSHELRTPLNAIVGYVRMLQSGLLTGDKRRRAIDTIARNVTALKQIVDDVLDVSRIISGKLRLNLQTVEIAPVIETAIETVRPAADAKGVHLESKIDRRAATVSGDPERLQQILWNLLSNAVKFTERGGLVQVRLRVTEEHVELNVSDTGVGIDSDFLPHVFERFRQADPGITRTHGGLGLGLAITRHLVELQGGHISVTSQGRGKGATFRVALPLRASAVAVREVAPRPRGDLIPVPKLEGIRILAVDDDRDALTLVREILETTGATVVTADSGQQALDAIEHNGTDVLLADLAMPQMSGFELIDRVRHSDDPGVRDVPAAAVTAYARAEDRARALRSGFQMHLAKPIDPAELMAAMVVLTRHGRSQQP
jgi:PAS domain S-box-containing protein